MLNIESGLHVLAHMEAIPNDCDYIRPVPIHNLRKICIQFSALMQICDRQNRHLRYFDILTAHTLTSMRLASDSSFDFADFPFGIQVRVAKASINASLYLDVRYTPPSKYK